MANNIIDLTYQLTDHQLKVCQIRGERQIIATSLVNSLHNIGSMADPIIQQERRSGKDLTEHRFTLQVEICFRNQENPHEKEEKAGKNDQKKNQKNRKVRKENR